MKIIIAFSGFIFVLVNLILSSWSVINKDIYYYTDIGRDFLIFDEIATKKLVLVGPRSDAQGIFHGIAWHYFNMPAYLLAQGNPVIVGLFWILLGVGLVITSYFIVKKLFDKKSAIIAVLLLSTYLVEHMQGLFHGKGAWFVLPAYFYFFVRYSQTKKPFDLLGHLLMLGLLIQFEIAVGMPFALLSFVGLVYLMVRSKLFHHIFYFAFLIIPLSTFLMFDLRHDFLQIKSFLSYGQGVRNGVAIPFMISLTDRLHHFAYTGINLFKFPLAQWNLIVFGSFIYSFLKLKKIKDKYKRTYFAFIYFYVGFYLLTLLHGGLLIEFWWLPVSLLPILIFSTLHHYIPKFVYYGFLVLILGVSTFQNINYLKTVTQEMGKKTTSWQFHLNNAKQIYEDAPAEFGFFIYAPDIFGYQDKYAMLYTQRLYSKKPYVFTKKKITYVLIEPPPSFRTSDLSPRWWIEEKLKIKKTPIKTISLGLDYKIEKYELTDEELKIPSEITQADWLFFR
ncbi:MAG: hypothetical protein HYW86_03945 [Candidatus Roizmanbacteria bacterium]|nr:MAG: hypothetical protein HYW86_03945 [Candidatus Roizmanbacteria bacterium]